MLARGERCFSLNFCAFFLPAVKNQVHKYTNRETRETKKYIHTLARMQCRFHSSAPRVGPVVVVVFVLPPHLLLPRSPPVFSAFAFFPLARAVVGRRLCFLGRMGGAHSLRVVETSCFYIPSRMFASSPRPCPRRDFFFPFFESAATELMANFSFSCDMA